MSAVPSLPQDIVQTTHATASHASQTNGAYAVNSSSNGTTFNFVLHDTPIENFRPIKVIAIGAGYSGIYCGIWIPERIRNAEPVIHEKNAGIRGTWYENR